MEVVPANACRTPRGGVGQLTPPGAASPRFGGLARCQECGRPTARQVKQQVVGLNSTCKSKNSTLGSWRSVGLRLQTASGRHRAELKGHAEFTEHPNVTYYTTPAAEHLSFTAPQAAWR
ncbi:hypothetical protein EYF80_042528 [Liparis tanakae]|uniref:Uncharacterized protein n=1 Tax=Liparis tanakae TaxID=230148 RepID=A0A4Z2G3Y9_9TELE|nr:hypothetical protein EYF80_042528 [Liparis tanakae]